jgi:hypothetical protein
LSDDQVGELRDLNAVNDFYLRLLERHLGHPVPAPGSPLAAGETKDGANDPAASIQKLERWLHLLDLAISAPMVRDALIEPPSTESAESVFRYCVRKASPADSERDKTDFLGTFLLRNPAGGVVRPTITLTSSSSEATPYLTRLEQAQAFEKDIWRILGRNVYPLPPEHDQLLREFQYLHQEADDLRHFDQLMDCGILQRVRELKTNLGASFYHPRVLSTTAVYNVYFGKRFDDLFREAATQIKAFAAKVQQDGGSILSRVDGEVTVKNLADVEENSIMKQEYGKAQENFRKVSRFKKAVDSRRSRPGTPRQPSSMSGPPTGSFPAVRSTSAAPSTGAHPAPSAAAAASARPPSPPQPAAVPLAEAPGKSTPAAHTIEEARARGMIESIRNFVRAADPASAHIIPLRGGTITLTPPETEAFKTDYSGEKSFRSDYSAILTYLVALHARMQSEVEDYKSKRDSAYLWKPHADSLACLLTLANKALQESGDVCVRGEQRGLGEKVRTMYATQEKLRNQIKLVAEVLQS